jgi:glycolate oxidase FAD binding subunit
VNTTIPHTTDELEAVLHDAAADRQPVTPWGAGTRQHLGAAPPPGVLRLETTALRRVLEYNPADLTVTVEAGMILGTLQATLGEYGQWLPWDPPAANAATIGGLLASAASGPLRLGYGTPRDWVLGMRAVLGDGRVIKSGGRVVKNVAGYDAHKLHIGALGTLGVIVEVTLKLFPLPERETTLLIGCRDHPTALALCDRLRARPLAPASLVLLDRRPTTDDRATTSDQPPACFTQHALLIAVRFAGVPAAVERQRLAAQAAARTAGAEPHELVGPDTDAFWDAIAAVASPLANGTLLLRCGARPAELGTLLDRLRQYAPPEPPLTLLGYAGVGLAYARWPVDPEADRRLAALRTALAGLGGYVVVEEAPGDLRSSLDLWGPAPPTLAIMRALKAQWDPHGILNPGRYVGGI